MKRIAIAVACAAALPAVAVRLGFNVRAADGSIVKPAEVCVQSAGKTAIGRWFGEGPVECYPAETVMAFPSGRWSFFVVAEGAYVSTHPWLLPVEDHPVNTDRGYKEITVDVVRAASVRFTTVPTGHRAVVYFPGTRETLAFALPMRPNAEAMTIPAGFRFMPALVSPEGRVRFGDVHPPAVAGSRVTIEDFARSPTRDIVAALRRVPLPDGFELRTTRDLPAPRIELVTRDRTDSAQLPDGPVTDGELIVVKNAGAASGMLRLSGNTWETSEVAVTPGETIVEVPQVRLAPAAELRVSASEPAREWLRGLTRRGCASSKPGASNVVELRCIDDSCEPRTIELDALAESATVTFAGVPVGTYELRVRAASVRDAWRQTVSASPGVSELTIDPPLSFMSGNVTRGGNPVVAHLVAADGSARTGVDGAYTMWLSKKADRVVVHDCANDVRFVHLLDAPTARLDIELPVPAVVRVIDRKSAAPIEHAVVRVRVRDPDDPADDRVLEVAGETRADGGLTLPNTPLTRFSVCARADRYTPGCAESDSGNPVTIALDPVETFPGVIENVSSVQGGILFFVDRDGSVFEAAAVDSEGRFRHRIRHTPDRYGVFVSANGPLVVLPVPAVEPLRLHVPSIPPRPIVVRTPGAVHEIGLAIGGVIVPQGAMSRHMSLRGRAPWTSDGEMVIPMVLETAPITVYRGYALNTRPPHVPPERDPFAAPELRATFASAPAGRGAVVFP